MEEDRAIAWKPGSGGVVDCGSGCPRGLIGDTGTPCCSGLPALLPPGEGVLPVDSELKNSEGSLGAAAGGACGGSAWNMSNSVGPWSAKNSAGSASPDAGALGGAGAAAGAAGAAGAEGGAGDGAGPGTGAAATTLSHSDDGSLWKNSEASATSL